MASNSSFVGEGQKVSSFSTQCIILCTSILSPLSWIFFFPLSSNKESLECLEKDFGNFPHAWRCERNWTVESDEPDWFSGTQLLLQVLFNEYMCIKGQMDGLLDV